MKYSIQFFAAFFTLICHTKFIISYTQTLNCIKGELTMSDTLKVGDKAPDIEAETYGGETIKLSDFGGNKNVALYFYPRDNTGTCTKEACSMRDGMKELEKLGVQILGVSTDSVKSREGFKNKHSLNFPLLSDKGKKIIKTYGVQSDSGSGKKGDIPHRQIGSHKAYLAQGQSRPSTPMKSRKR